MLQERTVQLQQIPRCSDVSLLVDAAGNATTLTEADVLYLLSSRGQEDLRNALSRMTGAPRKEPL